MPQACPKPLGWQPHQSVKELASLREGIPGEGQEASLGLAV